MIGATKSGLFWIIGCVCAMFFGREGTAQEVVQAEYGERPRELQPAVTPEQRAAAEKLVAKYLAAAEAERPPVVDELKKLGDSSRVVIAQQRTEARQAAAAAQAAAKKAEIEGKTEEAAKLRAEAEKTAAKADALAKLFTLIATGTAGQKSLYGVRARE
jgi:cell division protein FtsN